MLKFNCLSSVDSSQCEHFDSTICFVIMMSSKVEDTLGIKALKVDFVVGSLFQVFAH